MTAETEKSAGSPRPVTFRADTWERMFMIKHSLEGTLRDKLEWSPFLEILLDVFEGVSREEAVKKRTEKK